MHGVPLCKQTRRRLQAIFPVRLLSLVARRRLRRRRQRGSRLILPPYSTNVYSPTQQN